MNRLLIFMLVLTGGFAATSTAEKNTPPVARIVDVCSNTLSEVNLNALREAAEILKESRPDLAKEISTIAARAQQ